MRTYLLMLLIAALLLAPTAAADLQLDGVSSDPGVIAAGDEVTLTVNFHDTSTLWYDFVNRGDYRLEVTLEAADTVSERYVTILDGNGERNIGHLFRGDVWRKNYRVKFSPEAPVGTYQMKLVFQYFKGDEPTSQVQHEYFTLDVLKEGIILDLAQITTSPREVRPGDEYVTIETHLANSGRKDAKAIELQLRLPDGFLAPYADNNRVWAGYLGAGEEQALTTHVNIDDDVAPGVYELEADITYHDLDDNRYAETLRFPLLVREKPHLVLVRSEGSLEAGDEGELRLTIRNDGTEKAEAVDVRLIKQSSQPFSFDARSDFIGALEPGENATAVFTIEATGDATAKEHHFSVLLRAKGDSDLGDDRIYTFTRNASIEVREASFNPFAAAGLLALGAIVLGGGGAALVRRNQEVRG